MRTLPAATVVFLLAASLALPATSSAAKHASYKQQIRVLRAKLAHEQRVVKNLRVQLAAAKSAHVVSVTPAALPATTPAPATVDTTPPAPTADPSATPYTDHAASVIRAEVDYTATVLANAGVTTSRDELAARAILSYVTGHISAPLYGSGVHPDGLEESLRTGSGICGGAAFVYASLAIRLGLPVRSVQFYYGTSDNHIADEVYYSGGWHYFDPTFGLYYTDAAGGVLSIDAARALADPAAALHYDATLLWTTVAQQAGIASLIDFSTETASTTPVYFGLEFSA